MTEAVATNECEKCGTALQPLAHFCPICGVEVHQTDLPISETEPGSSAQPTKRFVLHHLIPICLIVGCGIAWMWFSSNAKRTATDSSQMQSGPVVQPNNQTAASVVNGASNAATISDSTTFSQENIQVIPGQKSGEEYSAETPAQLCITSRASRVCYTPPDHNPPFGLDPKVNVVSLQQSNDALLFRATSSAGGSGSSTLLALLQIRNGQLANLLPETSLPEISEYQLWNLPDVSSSALLVKANFEWGEGETHYGSNHHFRVTTYGINAAGQYEVYDEYITANTYDPNLDDMGVLTTEQPTILAHLHNRNQPPSSTAGSDNVSTSEDEPAEQAIRALLDEWVVSFKQKDAIKQADCYAPQVETYYLKHNLSREYIQEAKSRAFASIGEIRTFQLSNINLSLDSSTPATAIFDKTWDTSLVSGKRFSGAERERLKLLLIDGAWRITSETEDKIYYVNR